MSTRYLPYHRTGAAALLRDDPTGQRAALGTLALEITDGTTPRRVEVPTLELAGPGEVLGLAPGQIGRIWPPKGCQDAEENLLPLLEFVEPDLPWRYSPAAATKEGRLPPWLALLALRVDWVNRGAEEPEAVLLASPDPSAGLPQRVAIRAGTPLPRLEFSWAWAHVEQFVTEDETPEEVSQTNARARILCPRKLAPNTRYLMVLVPSYRGGAQAGLGEKVDAQASARSWPQDATWAGDDSHVLVGVAGLSLPVYHHWTFKTGVPGDIEALARKLRVASELPPGVGALNLRLTLPTLGADQVVTMETSLGGLPTEHQPAEPDALLRAKVVEALGLDSPAVDPDTGDPMIRPPMYGEQHALARRGIRPPLGQTSDQVVNPTRSDWFNVLNSDPRWRVVAGVGAEVVRRHQETYLEEAWKWLGDHRGALARQQLRQQIQWNWRLRAVAPAAKRLQHQLATARKADEIQGADAAMRLAPLLGRMMVDKEGRSALASVATRRALRPTSKLGRLVASDVDESGRSAGFAALTFRADVLSKLTWPGGKDSEVRGKYRPKRLARAVDRTPLAPPALALSTEVVANNLHRALPKLLAMLGGRAVAEPDPPAPLLAPAINAPTSLRLRELSNDWLLAGAATLPDDRVYLLQPNQRFIEAFLTGMNHEIARELLWREFPTDGRATVFAHFWESLKEPPQPAITRLHSWTSVSGLGEHQTTGRPPLVLLIRSSILRRYPKLILFLGRFKKDQGQFQSVAGQRVVAPDFKGELGQDASFFGFTLLDDHQNEMTGKVVPHDDWYFVLQEMPGAPRFGLDLREEGWEQDPTLYTPNPLRSKELDWLHLGGGPMLAPVADNLQYLDINADGTLPGKKPDGSPKRPLKVTSATFAACTFQQPVQIFIPFNLMLRRT